VVSENLEEKEKSSSNKAPNAFFNAGLNPRKAPTTSANASVEYRSLGLPLTKLSIASTPPAITLSGALNIRPTKLPMIFLSWV